MKIKIKCADKEARDKIADICENKDNKTDFEVLLCDIVVFADNCEDD